MIKLFTEVFNKYQNQLIYRQMIQMDYPGPIVSFTFDDFPETCYDPGADILERYGFKGTYFTSLSLLEKENHLGKMANENMIMDLHLRGHEIGSHTWHHKRANQMSKNEFLKELELNEQQLTKLLPDYKLKSFSYPYGSLKPVLKLIANDKFCFSRGTYEGKNTNQIDQGLLKAIKIYHKNFSQKKINRLLKDAVKRKVWLIFYTHDIRDNCSSFGCTPYEFQYVVDLAAEMGFRGSTIGNMNQFILTNGLNHDV